jgi:hypothetical protein
MPKTSLKEKFAQFSGAKLQQPSKAESVQVELPAVVEDPNMTPLKEEQQSYVQESFQRSTALWKNPKVTLAVVAVISVAITGMGMAILNGNFQMPDFSASSKKPPVSDDDTKPQPRSDGDWQAAALAGGLGDGFEKEKDLKNPYLSTASKKAGSKKTLKAGSLASSAPLKPTYYKPPTAPMVTPERTVPLRLPARPPVPSVTMLRPVSKPAVSPLSKPVSVTGSSAAPKMSAEERRLAVLAATSSGNSATQGVTGQGAGAPAQGVQAQPPDYQTVSYLASESAVLDGVPQELISRSNKAEGRLLMGVAFTPSDAQFMQGQPVEIAVENPLDSGLPIGTRIVAKVDLPGTTGTANTTQPTKSAVIRLIPTALIIGDAEYPLADESASGAKSVADSPILLAGKNGKPLIAKRQGSEFLRFLGETLKTVAGGLSSGIANIGLGGGTGLLSSIPTTQILGGVVGPTGTPSTSSSAIEVLALRENTKIEVHIMQPISIPAGTSADVVPMSPDMQMAESAQPDEQLSEVAQTEPSAPTALSDAIAQPLTDEELMALMQEAHPQVVGVAGNDF